jgi:RNA polymerase sigma factor (sigma-70 family)
MGSVPVRAALRQIQRLFGEGTLAGLSDARLLARYSSERDEMAFETLVERHGRMVMAVCRGVVDDANDADDAFQAAFLLLARKSGSLWVSDSVGGWLHRVAYRIALQVKSDAARRRRQERRAAERTDTTFHPGPPWDDLHAVLHQEIDRLPERYRKPIVLCYLEEMTYQQAASALRWSEGTTRGRLARGRDVLRVRLNRRGVQPADATLASVFVSGRNLALPAEMLCATVRAARHFTLGKTAGTATVSATTTALVTQAMRGMMLTRLKLAGAAAVFVGLLTCVAVGLATAGPSEGKATKTRVDGRNSSAPEDQAAVQDQVAKPSEKQPEAVTFRGRVLGPDGKPVVAAAVCTLSPRHQEPVEPVLKTKADTDGRFQFDIPRAEFDAVVALPFASLTILASAPGLGPDWVALRTLPDADISLKLVDDSVPIVGRIIDLQGKPVVGARVTRGRINAEGPAGIDSYLALVREDPMKASNHNFAKNYWEGVLLPGQPASVVTDAEGRFRLTGIGRDRIVEMNVEGPAIQSASILAMTREGAKVSSPPGTFAGVTIYSATFEHFIPPGRSLTGVVLDKRTKQPLSAVAVGGRETNARTTTDGQGRFTLVGFPKGKSYELMVLAGQKPPYFVTCLKVSDTAGLEPIEANVECQPGIPLRLKLIDKETGQPVTNADVFYEPIHPNPHAREVSGYAPVLGSGPYNSGIRQDDGPYLLGVLPGPGGVFVRTAKGLYRPACVDPKSFFKVTETKESKAEENWLYGDIDTIFTAVGEGWGGTPQSQFSAIVLVNPAEDARALNAEIALERDRKREVRVTGPDGEPPAGVTAEGDGAEATRTPGLALISKLNPLRPQRFTFRHAGKKLVGCLLARGDEPEPYTIKLQPWGVITGRLVDAEGKPRSKVDLMTIDWQIAVRDLARGVIASGQRTDSDGRFRYEGLVPGQEYSANAVGEQAMKGGFGVVIDRVVLKPGEIRDLGDVRSRADKAAAKP